MISLPLDFYEQHGEETLTIVFKLTYYHQGGIFEEVPATAPTEAQINFAIHKVITKILLTPKSEE